MPDDPIDPDDHEEVDPPEEGPISDRLQTGVPGLDGVLRGGLIPNRSYLVRGEPGTGKTTLGLQFLTASTNGPEDALYISFEESEANVRANADSIGIDLTDLSFLDMSPDPSVFTEEGTYDIFAPSEVEQSTVTERIKERVEAIEPSRVVLDPITQLRYLAPDEYQFRQQLLSFMTYLTDRDATILFTSQATEASPDDDLQFMSDGTIELRSHGDRHTISITKLRGSSYQGGTHDVAFSDGGLVVYPQLIPEYHERTYDLKTIASGVPELDSQLNGGIERGTVTIISGPTGVGKTTLGTQFMKEAAGRGERSAIYLFEETPQTFIERSAAINLPIRDMLEQGNLTVEPIEPMTYSSEKFGNAIRAQVEREGADIVMIDGVDGYRLSLRGDDAFLNRKLHSLCRYMKNMGVTVILVDEIQSVTGNFHATSENISYLADNIVFFRYVEVDGEIRKVIGVLKKRASDFERSLREFEITEHGITVGPAQHDFRGILTGTPTFIGDDGVGVDG